MSPAGAASVYKLASVLLQYPTAALFDGLDALDGAAAGTDPPAAGRAFGAFLRWLRGTAPADVAQHYVDTFDLRRRCTLYLTYHRYGDTRERGMALLAFKTAYRGAGYETRGDELPDYLPLVLDFAALAPRGPALLRAHRTDVELLRRALRGAASPYAEVVEAVCASLPRLGRRDLARVDTAWRGGPPAERVGLEPFGPPWYSAGPGRPA